MTKLHSSATETFIFFNFKFKKVNFFCCSYFLSLLDGARILGIFEIWDPFRQECLVLMAFSFLPAHERLSYQAVDKSVNLLIRFMLRQTSFLTWTNGRLSL